MSKKIDVVYGNFNNIDLDDILPRLEDRILKEKKIGRIRFFFVSDEDLLVINKTHLDHDYYTDIITFDYSSDRKLIGEVYISIDRVKENGRVFTLELVRVMSHGVLHMLGFKDKSESEKEIMRGKENEWIQHIVSRES